MKKRLLVVDDEEIILAAVEEYFLVLGHCVTVARSAEEAIGFLQTQSFQALVADLRLGGSNDTDGLRVVKTARERCDQVRIAVMSAYGTPEIVAEALQLGADRYYDKPVALAELARFVTN